MKIEVKDVVGWHEVLDAARETVWKNPVEEGHEPSLAFKKQILEDEHSPIRVRMLKIRMIGIPYFLSVHLVRHKYGVEHFVSTQRDDRNPERKMSRKDMPQGALVNHTMYINAQELMFISRRRLCGKADPDMRNLWRSVIDKVREIDPVLADYCVPMCVYRNGCHEANPCGVYKSTN